LVLLSFSRSVCDTTLHTTECARKFTKDASQMSNELLAIIIAVCIFIPTVLFYHFIIVDNYLDKFLPPTFKSLFSNGKPRNLSKKKDGL